MAEFAYQVKIPKERVAVLIGKKGEVKKQIEETTGIAMEIDSKEGEVNVIGDDALMLYSTREIIKAIARGFNPEIAMLLLPFLRQVCQIKIRRCFGAPVQRHRAL